MKQAIRKLILALAVGAGLSSASAQPITVQTSDNLLDLGQKWAEAYTAKHPETKIEVTTGTPPDIFAALAGRKTDLVTVARKIRFKETQACEAVFGQRPAEFKVGVIGTAVYVNADNPVTVLTYDELEAAFTGKRRNWKQLGGKDAAIVAYAVATNTLAGELFALEVLGGKPMTNDVRLMSEAELSKVIAGNPNAIGFGALARAEGIRAINIKRAYSSTPVEPGADTIANRIYPISQFIYCYLNPDANKGEIKAYLDWIRSDEGQPVAAQAGCYVVPAKWRATP
jgi:phosphate transport system substrate-binding protein